MESGDTMQGLDQLTPGRRVRIEFIEVGTALAARLMAMAMLPGAWVEVIRVAPLGDPILIRLEQGVVSLRRRDAAVVRVSDDL